MVFESTSMRYETLVARFWLRVRGVPQSSCRRQSRDKRQELWGRECPHIGLEFCGRHFEFLMRAQSASARSGTEILEVWDSQILGGYHRSPKIIK